MGSSTAADNVDPSVDSSSVGKTSDTGEETDLDSNAKLALQGRGVHEKDSELSAEDQGGSSQNIGANVAKDVSFTSSLAPDNFDPSFDSSSVPMTYDTSHETELDSSAKLALEDHGVHENDSELSAQDQGGSSRNAGGDVAEDVLLRTSNSEGGTIYDHASKPVALLSPHASISTAVDESITAEKESEKSERSLPLSEDISNTPVVLTREDQVTNLGCALSPCLFSLMQNFMFNYEDISWADWEKSYVDLIYNLYSHLLLGRGNAGS